MHSQQPVRQEQTHPEHPVRECEVGNSGLHRRNHHALQLQDRAHLRSNRGHVLPESAVAGQGCQRHHWSQGGSDQTSRGSQILAEGDHHRHSAEGTAARQTARLRGRLRLDYVLQGNLRQNKHLLQQPREQDLLRVVAPADQTRQAHHCHPEGERGGEGAGERTYRAAHEGGEEGTGENRGDGALLQDGRPQSGGADSGVFEAQPHRGNQKRHEMLGVGGVGTQESQVGCDESAVAEQGDRDRVHSY